MKFVVYTSRYDENSGGNICLHRLCHLINEAGFGCEMVFFTRKILEGPRRLVFKRLLDKVLAYIYPPASWVKKEWISSRVGMGFVKLNGEDIVIYPEVVSGNPLGAKNVVRWLLYHPGVISGKVGFSNDGLKPDLLIRFNNAVNLDLVRSFNVSDLLLEIIYYPIEKYLCEKEIKRKGVAYIVRKGRRKKTVHPSDAICVDGLSHDEMAVIFKQVKTLISYDCYTAYSRFAAIAGADSIVVPDEGLSEDQWYPDIEDRYGISYGFNNISWARKTRSLLIEKLKTKQEESRKNVCAFIAECQNYFFGKG
jgi:hypothetical protein